MLDSLAPARRRFYPGIGALVLVAVVAAVTLTLVRKADGPDPVDPVDQNARPPILLVPGYGGSTASLDVLARALRATGRSADVVTLGGGGVGDLRGQADDLDAAVRATLKQTGASSVDLVGYSAGGVVVRLWVATHDGGSITRRVVTLGSPHHGTAVAGLASDIAPSVCPAACKQLAPDSSLLRSLNTGDETPAGPRWVSIWTTEDRTVVPATSASLSGAVDFSVQSVCPGTHLSHGDLPRNKTVIAMVKRELGRGDPSVPPGSVCVSR